MEKGLLTQLGEVIDRYSAERQSRQHLQPVDTQVRVRPGRFARILSLFLPNFGTLILVAALLMVNNVGALSFFAPNTATQSTGTIAYQGRLADSGGSPITATVNMIFRLYAGVSGGSPLWEEQWTGANSVQVSDGLFNVMLGSLTPIPQTVITGNSNLFLGITVGTDNEMSPRVQLGSVPFATQALTVPDGSITKAKLAADVSLVPPDGSITTAKLANGAVTGAKLARKMTKVTPTGDIPLPNANTSYDVLLATINLEQETLVSIDASVGLQNNSGDGLLYALVEVDGDSIITSHYWQKAGIGEQHMLSTSLLLTPGQHIVKLKAGSGMNNSAVNGDNRTQMVIIEG